MESLLEILNINQKKKSDVLRDKCAAEESISSMSKLNIVNQLGWHDFSFG